MKSHAIAPAISWAVTLLVMLGLDAAWLSTMAGPLYRAQLGPLLLPAFNAAPALVFYLLYAAGLVVFVVSPARAGRGWRSALGRGGLFGIIAYATYDLTNQATLRGWSGVVTAADLAWGMVLSATSAAAACAITDALLGRERPIGAVR